MQNLLRAVRPDRSAVRGAVLVLKVAGLVLVVVLGEGAEGAPGRSAWVGQRWE
ncbi:MULTISPECIES: hypothetical protein [Streptomycetaceae]|uniref:hypothetical protein n=1 Tax=unclassified Streptomyces TaxID=2593676 RepID=UPI0033EC5E23